MDPSDKKTAAASTPGPYITCRQLIDFLGDYMADELSESEQREIARHLAVCPSCVAYLDSYAQTIRLERAARSDLAKGAASSAASDAAPSQLPEDLVRKILAARSRVASAR